MLAYSDVVFKGQLKKPEQIAKLQYSSNQHTEELETIVDSFDNKKDGTDKELIAKVKAAKKSIQYIEKTCKLLGKLATEK